MDDMAKALGAYAGGLQQSFESVFERVGQSLSQSADVMRMMNEVMESAMLQNLWISSSYQVHGGLIIDVKNHSEIALGQTKIRAQLYSSEEPFFSATLDSLGAMGRIQLQASIHDVPRPIAGFIELECISPGTQQPLTKRSPFRVVYFQLGRFQALRSAEEGASPGPTEVTVASDRFLLTKVRDLLEISPIDGILRDDEGRYRFHPEFPLPNNPVLYLSVKTGGAGDPAFQVTVSAAGSADTAEDRRRQCQQIINELETVDSDDSDY